MKQFLCRHSLWSDIGLCALLALILAVLLGIHRQVDSMGTVSKNSFDHHYKRFCLNMIVKNEEKNILRTLRSAVPEISGWYICDTGSIDHTMKLIVDFFVTKRIPGKLKRHTWRDFSYNRNQCLRDGTKEMSACDYWMILDADQVLINDSPTHLWEYRMDADAYFLKERSHGAYFSNLRIIRVGSMFEYRGRIHESIYPKDGLGRKVVIGNLPNSVYSIHDNEQTRTYEHDIDLLLQELQENPEDSRTHFYLAKAYKAIPNFNASMYHYAKRIQVSNGTRGSEEVFLSYLEIGTILEELYVKDMLTEDHVQLLKDFGMIKTNIESVKDIVPIYQMASHYLDYRYEPYAHIAMAYWFQEKNAGECYRYANKGIQTGSFGNSFSMFTSEKSLHCLYYMKCVCGYHSKQFDTLLDSCQFNVVKLPLNPKNVESWEHEYISTSKFYLTELRGIGIF